MRRAIMPMGAVLCLLASLWCAGCAGKSAPAAPTDPKSVARVRAPLLNLRQCPSLTCDVAEDLTDGQEVAVLTPVLNGWVQVRVLASGREGYVEARFLGR